MQAGTAGCQNRCMHLFLSPNSTNFSKDIGCTVNITDLCMISESVHLFEFRNIFQSSLYKGHWVWVRQAVQICPSFKISTHKAFAEAKATPHRKVWSMMVDRAGERAFTHTHTHTHTVLTAIFPGEPGLSDC